MANQIHTFNVWLHLGDRVGRVEMRVEGHRTWGVVLNEMAFSANRRVQEIQIIFRDGIPYNPPPELQIQQLHLHEIEDFDAIFGANPNNNGNNNEEDGGEDGGEGGGGPNGGHRGPGGGGPVGRRRTGGSGRRRSRSAVGPRLRPHHQQMVNAIEFYSDWFNIEMPPPKCDLIGIPEFQMGAQENWGLISSREVYLLYDPAQSSSKLKQLPERELELLDRFQIADDLFAIIQSCQMPITAFLEFFACAAQEEKLVILQSMFNSFAHINSVLEGQFYKFICKIVEPVSARYGWEPKEGESHLTVQLRALLINLLALCHHQPTIQIAIAKFKEYIEKKMQLLPDLRTVIFNAVARTGDKQAIEELKRIFVSCNFSEIERACLTAFGQCTDSTLLEELFDHCILKKSIKSQDIYKLFSGVSNSACANSQLQTWAFFVRNVQLFRQPPKTSLFQSCFKYAAECLCSTQSINDVMELI